MTKRLQPKLKAQTPAAAATAAPSRRATHGDSRMGRNAAPHTRPTYVEAGVAPRHIDLRPFVLSGKSMSMVPGETRPLSQT